MNVGQMENDEFKNIKSVTEDPFFKDFFSLSDWKLPKVQRKRDWTTRLDVRGFKSENITVKVSGKKIIVLAEQKDGDDFTLIKRHFPIADGVNVDALTSNISPNGVLVISAPCLKSESNQMQNDVNNMIEELTVQTGFDNSCFDMQLNDNHRKRLRSILNWGDVSCPAGGVGSITDDEHGNKSYQIGFNMKQYEPQEIQLKCKGYKLLLDTKHVEDGPNHHVNRVMHKSVKLPETVDTSALKSILNADGTLQVKAPILSEAELLREIPISFKGMIEME